MPSAGVRPANARGSGGVASLSAASSDRRARIRPVAVLPRALFAATVAPEGKVFERVCENCGQTFQAKRATAKTCRAKCRRELYRRRHGAD